MAALELSLWTGYSINSAEGLKSSDTVLMYHLAFYSFFSRRSSTWMRAERDDLA